MSKELRSIIRSLLAKASGVLELFFDHCIYTMLQELDKAPGQHPGAPCPPPRCLLLVVSLEALCNSSSEAVAEQDLPHLHSRGVSAWVQDLHPGTSLGQAPDCYHQPGQGELG